MPGSLNRIFYTSTTTKRCCRKLSKTRNTLTSVSLFFPLPSHRCYQYLRHHLKFIENLGAKTQLSVFHGNKARNLCLSCYHATEISHRRSDRDWYVFIIYLNGCISMHVLEAGSVTVLKGSGNSQRLTSLPFIQSAFSCFLCLFYFFLPRDVDVACWCVFCFVFWEYLHHAGV